MTAKDCQKDIIEELFKNGSSTKDSIQKTLNSYEEDLIIDSLSFLIFNDVINTDIKNNHVNYSFNYSAQPELQKFKIAQ